MVASSVACTSVCVLVEVHDPIKLKHYGKREILAKIDLMEDEYDVPMRFDAGRIPSVSTAAGQQIGEWGYGVGVYGAARGYVREKETPSLMSSMYGCRCDEELQDTQKYLREHGGYQLEHVSSKSSKWGRSAGRFVEPSGRFVSFRV